MKKVIKAPAKVNLCLRVDSKRDDEYHNLAMIMQKISLYDTIEFEIISENDFDFFKLLPKIEIPIKFDDLPKIELPIKFADLPKIDFDFINKFFKKKFDYASDKQINIQSNYNYIPTDEKNLVYKVIDYIFKKYDINDKIYVYLKKMIPTSGGLGGGSSDAAAMLMFLNKHYNLNLSIDDMTDIALKFGSDIPFFLHKKVSICKGRGEKIEELKPFNNYYILLATPNVRVSTKEIYTKFDMFEISDERKQEENIKFENVVNSIENRDIKGLAENVFNDLEIVTEPMFQQVSNFKSKMMNQGAIKSLMSGSGPTVFGIFDSYFKANNCKNALKKEYPSSFIFISKPIAY